MMGMGAALLKAFPLAYERGPCLIFLGLGGFQTEPLESQAYDFPNHPLYHALLHLLC